jgi:hypothetical protein
MTQYQSKRRTGTVFWIFLERIVQVRSAGDGWNVVSFGTRRFTSPGADGHAARDRRTTRPVTTPKTAITRSRRSTGEGTVIDKGLCEKIRLKIADGRDRLEALNAQEVSP